MTARLFTTSERGLATLRIKAFRHVHDLPLLTQNTERRGALVSRVTSDVDQVSQFLVFGGLLFVVSVGQVLVATIVMLFYSWQLALVVWVCFAPLFLSLRYFQRKLSDAYGVVRRQVAVMLSAISEPVVGAAVVRSYAVEDRTQARIDDAIDEYKAASTRAQGFTVLSFSLGGISAGLANAGVIIVGVWLGFAGDITAGTVLAFAFLVTLFVGPVQMGTQILTDAQNAVVSWRRVIGILETPADLVDPGPDGATLPRGPVDVRFDAVTFAYPGGPPVLRDIDLDIAAGTRMAVVGETGSGKSTIAKLLTRLMDPSRGRGAARRHRRARDRAGVAAAQRGAGAAGGLPLRRHHRGQRPLRAARRDRRGDPRRGRRPRARRLAGRPARRHPDRGRASAASRMSAGERQLVALLAGPARRPGPAGPRRGHQRGRPGARDADRPRPGAADDAAAPRSPSRTGSPPPRPPTRWSSSTRAGSCSAARTPCSRGRPGPSTPACTRWVAQHGS